MGIFDFFSRKEEHRDDNLGTFKKMYVDIQEAVSKRDESTLRALCTDEMLASLMDDRADNNRNRTKNVVENIVIEHIYTVDSNYDCDLKQDFQTVQIQATMSDYYTDMNGNIVEGTIEPIFVEDTWEFTRMDGSSNWYVSDISAGE